MDFVKYVLKLIVGAVLATSLGYLLGFALYARAESKPVRIAVIDSGISTLPLNIKLCKDGHKDFTGTGLADDLGHGTAVAHIISSHIKDVNACIVVIKVFTRYKKSQMLSYIAGLKYATQINADYVNMSLTGYQPQLVEELLVQRLLTQGKRVIAASGNEGHDLNKMGCVIYPACYDKRIVIVGDLMNKKARNWGRYVDYYDNGSKQLIAGRLHEGTSMATAHVTGKLVRKKFKAL